MSDWDLGQSLIERGFCSLEQIQEALSIQDRMKAMGVVPKPLPEILLEKRYVTREQLRQVGVEAAPAAPKGARAPAARPPARRASPAVWFLLVAFGGFVAAVLVFGPEILKTVGTNQLRNSHGRDAADSGPTDAERADAAAKEALDRITAFERTANDFENADEVAGRYRAYMEKHAQEKWELEGNRRLQDYCAKAESFARPKLEEILRDESLLREKGQTVELLKRLRSFPAKFLRVTESGRVVREKIGELSARQKEAYLHGKAEAEKLLGEKKFEAALDRVVALRLSAPEEVLDELEKLRVRIDFEWKATTQKVRQEVADVYYKVDGAFKEALARKPADPRKAAAVVAEFLYAPWHEEERPFARAKGVDFEALRKALEEWKPEQVASICDAAVPDAATPEGLTTAETAILQLRNAAYVALFFRDLAASFQKAVESREPLDLPTLGAGHFEKKGGKTVFLADGGGVVDPERNPLTERDLAALALRAGPADAFAHAKAGFYFYYNASGFTKDAYDHLFEAQKGRVKGVRPFLADLTVASQMELDRSLRVKFEAARDLFGKGQKAQAKKLLDELRERADHPFVKEKMPEVETMLFDVAEGSRREKELAVAYKGKGEALDGGRARVTYDFSDKAQLDAFEFVTEDGPRKFKGRWKLERQGLESSVEPSVLRWKTPVKGDVLLEYDLTLIDEAQNVVVDLYYNKGAARHYAAVLGFDWVGRADGDVQNTAEDRFGMPRTCVIKYPVAVDKSRWVLAAEWENWKSRLVGTPKGDWKPAKGKTYRMQVARQGKAIRLSADKATVWEGEDDAYHEGQVVFFSDSRCRVSNLSITFKPE